MNYIFRYVFREQEKNIANDRFEQPKNEKGKFIIRHNIHSRSVKGLINEFKENEKYRIVHRKDSVKLFHTIISFSNKDKEHIDDKLLKDIAKKFIEERGPNNLYAGTKHEDKDHIHLHLAISGTQLNGRSSRVSKQKFHSIKLALDRYQREKYPRELANSLPEHGKAKRLEKEAIRQTAKSQRQTDKQALLECLERAFAASKSREQFVSRIVESGHQPYYRNGSFQGIRFEGKMKFRLNRLGFDETRLKTLDQVKALDELQRLRAGDSRDRKRGIVQPNADKRQPVPFNRTEKQLQELSAIRDDKESKEMEVEDAIENRSTAPDNDEPISREENQDSDKETGEDENENDEPSPGME